MSISAEWLIQNVLDFMTVLYQCYSNTPHAGDRTIYAKDIATAMSWIVEIRAGANVKDVVNRILAPETDKYFGDYWRQGEWGNREMEALEKLKSSVQAG